MVPLLVAALPLLAACAEKDPGEDDGAADGGGADGGVSDGGVSDGGETDTVELTVRAWLPEGEVGCMAVLDGATEGPCGVPLPWPPAPTSVAAGDPADSSDDGLPLLRVEGAAWVSPPHHVDLGVPLPFPSGTGWIETEDGGETWIAAIQQNRYVGGLWDCRRAEDLLREVTITVQGGQTLVLPSEINSAGSVITVAGDLLVTDNPELEAHWAPGEGTLSIGIYPSGDGGGGTPWDCVRPGAGD